MYSSALNFLPQSNGPIYQRSMFTLKLLSETQLSLLHSQLLGTPFTNVFTQYTQIIATDQNLATFDALSRVHCTKCFVLLCFHYLQVLITVN